jgi:hypothetical protein
VADAFGVYVHRVEHLRNSAVLVLLTYAVIYREHQLVRSVMLCHPQQLYLLE